MTDQTDHVERPEPSGPTASAPMAPASVTPSPAATTPVAPASAAPAPAGTAPVAPSPVAPQPAGTGPRTWPRSFADRLTEPLPGLARMVRAGWGVALRPRRADVAADTPRLPVAPGPLPDAPDGAVAVSWAGHASWVLRLGGLTVLTDPVWSRRIPATPPRITPVGVAWEALPPIDAVVISHNHYDHLDAPTLRRLPRTTPLLVPAGLAAWCRRRGFTRTVELDWWEECELGGVRFAFVPAHHWSRRTLTDTCRSLWGGWVLTDGAGRRVYFAGDTGYGHWFAEIGRRHPGIDVALLPIGAYAPRPLLRAVHTDPEEAVRACGDVGARIMAPMHWATFLLSAEPPLQPLTRVRVAWQAAGRHRDDLWDLPVGASRVLDTV
ncbi:MBL fold metallo-hydrolase [Streptantibioticus silvisoli]|uniref:MBL fold metallo-hydrolase n=1 Tax=Streptantibioticus silvisoli TaxID=2705255 RepID=UPI003F6B4A4E